MTSKISLFSLIKEDMRHRVWQWALSILMAIVCGPISILFYLENVANFSTGDIGNVAYSIYQDCLCFVSETYIILQMVVVWVGAIIVGVAGFSYLFSKRKVDVYHSMPISRSRWFLVLYLDGFLIWFVPFFGGLLATWLIGMGRMGTFFYSGEFFLALLKAACVLLLGFFVLYNFSIVCVEFCGTALNTLILMAVMGLVVSILYGGFNGLAAMSFDTFVKAPIEFSSVSWLSPLLSPVTLCSQYSNNGGFSEAVVFLIGTIVVTIGELVGAYFLHKSRPSERAESGMTNKPLQHILRVLGGLAAGLVGAWLMAEVSVEMKLGWGLFGAILGSFLAFVILEIVFRRSFKELFSHVGELLGVVAATGLIFISFQLDWFHYDTYLPSEGSIASVEMYCSSFSNYASYGISFDEKGRIKNRYYEEDLEKGVTFLDVNSIYQLLERSVELQKNGWYTDNTVNIQVKVNRKFGAGYVREYTLTDEDVELLRRFIETDNYLNAAYPVFTGQVPDPVEIELSGVGDASNYTLLDPSRIRQFMTAIEADFRDHSSMEELSQFSYLTNVYLTYPNADRPSATSTISIEIPNGYTRTLALLEEWYPDTIWGSPKVTDFNVNCFEYLYDLPLMTDTELLNAFFNPDSPHNLSYYYKQAQKSAEYYSYCITLPADVDVSELMDKVVVGYSYINNSLFGGDSYMYLGEYPISEYFTISAYVKKADIPESVRSQFIVSETTNYSTDAVYEGSGNLWNYLF